MKFSQKLGEMKFKIAGSYYSLVEFSSKLCELLEIISDSLENFLKLS